jgi:hypothetical protein
MPLRRKKSLSDQKTPPSWREPGVYAGEDPDPQTQEQLRQLGFFWPGEMIPSIIRAPSDWSTAPIFCGTGTMLGGNLMLTARHVLQDAFQDKDQFVYAAVWDSSEKLRVVNIRVLQYEVHPDPRCDLAIARLAEWNARCPFGAFGYGSPLNEVFCAGYPEDLAVGIQQGDFSALNNPRYLRGYITRALETDRDPIAPRPCFELSFPLAPGMSGSPIWGYDQASKTRILLGIAIKSQFERLVVGEVTVHDSQEREIGVERVARLFEWGVAVRLSAVLTWEIEMLDGRPLHSLIPNPEATGEVPTYLRSGSEYWRSPSPDPWPDDNET